MHPVQPEYQEEHAEAIGWSWEAGGGRRRRRRTRRCRAHATHHTSNMRPRQLLVSCWLRQVAWPRIPREATHATLRVGRVTRAPSPRTPRAHPASPRRTPRATHRALPSIMDASRQRSRENTRRAGAPDRSRRASIRSEAERRRATGVVAAVSETRARARADGAPARLRSRFLAASSGVSLQNGPCERAVMKPSDGSYETVGNAPAAVGCGDVGFGTSTTLNPPHTSCVSRLSPPLPSNASHPLRSARLGGRFPSLQHASHVPAF